MLLWTCKKKSVGTAKFARESLLVTYSCTKQFLAETSANLLLASDVKINNYASVSFFFLLLHKKERTALNSVSLCPGPPNLLLHRQVSDSGDHGYLFVQVRGRLKS